MARPWMRGSSRTVEQGVRAWLAKFTSSSRISLCLKIKRPPFLHPSACCREKWASQASHLSGKLSGVSAYLIDNSASWNSCTERTVPFMVDGRTKNHVPFSFPLQIVRLFSAVIGRKTVTSFFFHIPFGFSLSTLPFRFALLLSDSPIENRSFREEQRRGVHKLMLTPSSSGLEISGGLLMIWPF